jgi:hypothetical protein
MVPYSTLDSIKNGEASWLAILETILAVAAYWGIAWYFDTHTHLLISVLVAPLLLLRSPESTELGVKWFLSYWESTKTTNSNLKLRHKIIFYLCNMLAIVVAILVFISFNDGSRDIDLLIFLSLIISTAVYTITASVFIFSNSLYIIMFNKSWLSDFLSYAFLVPLIFVFIIGIISFFIKINNLGNHTKINLLLALFLIFYSFSGLLAIGIWIKALYIRIFSTARFFVIGFKRSIENLLYALTVIDMSHQCELVPGLNAYSDGLTLETMANSFTIDNLFSKMSGYAAKFAWFTVALFYRWSLKSTCWLYLPLVYLAWPRKASAEDDKLWLRLLYQGRMETVRRVTALLVGVSIALYTFPLLHLAGIHVDMPQAPALAYLLAFDLKKLAELAPWQWCSLLTAAITAAVWLISERLQYRLELTNCWQDRAARWLLHLVRTRTVVTAVSMLLAFGFVVLGFPKFYPDSFPGWMNVDLATLPHWLGFIRWIYGPYLSGSGFVVLIP